MKVLLSDMEWLACRAIGTSRGIANRALGVTDRLRSGKYAPDIEADGVAAELALHKHFGAYPVGVFDITPRSGSSDFMNVDVKSTRHLTGKLIATLKENKDVDVYILAIIDPPYVDLCGWTYASDLRTEENIVDLGYGPTYCMDRNNERFRKLT